MIEKAPRILHIGKNFYPDPGGIEAATMAISEMLATRGIRADVLATKGGLPTYPPLALDYSVIRCLATLRFGTKIFSLGFLNAIRRLQPDYDLAIVQTPNPLAVAGLLAFWRKPLIIVWQADIPYPLVRAVLTPFDRLLIRRADVIVAMTPVHLRESALADALVPGSVIIGHPLDRAQLVPPSEPTAAGQRVRDFLAGRKMLLSVGRLVPYKGFGVLIEATRGFPPGLATVIAGDGPIRANLQKAIDDAQLNDRVLLTGRVDDASLNDIRNLAYIGCMPSLSSQEMYGIAQVEFLGLGKPVISSRLARSAVPWVNRDGESGLLVEPGSVADLTRAVHRLFDDPDLYARLSVGATAAFARNNDIDRIADDWAELVCAVAQGKSIPAHLRIDAERFNKPCLN